jgi:hypothetical protein
MHKLESLIVGWTNTNIRAVADVGFLSQFSSVLISSIDSATDLSTTEMRSVIAKFDPACVVLGSGIVVRGESMVRLARDMDLFSGFDEVWCFDRFPNTPKPSDLWIVSPINIETDEPPANLLSWMVETDCQLALGDGGGLNFATFREEIAVTVQHLQD